jgi:hypothetical protein
MSDCSDIADYQWLIGAEAARYLEELAARETPLHTLVTRLRRHLSLERTHLLIEQMELRRRAAEKFSNPGRMFFTRTSLEQATDEHVARYKATRFAQKRAGEQSPSASAGRPARIVDLCCGIGGDLIALTERGSVTAVDRNPIVALLAAANLRSMNYHAKVVACDVAEFAIDNFSAWHIDPDRRAGGRRTTSLELCEPNLGTMERLLIRAPHAAVKLAPATKVPATWAEVAAATELEWISRGGECRQLVAWHGNLAKTPGQRRATILAATPGSPPRTLTGIGDQAVELREQVDQYIFDMDPAVLAAQLKPAIATEHNISALSHGPTYLTGPKAIFDSALTCFRVDEVLPFRAKSLAALLRERRIGRLEIKKRGIEISPEALRRELKLRGDHVATLLVTPVAGRPTAVLASRVPQ